MTNDSIPVLDYDNSDRISALTALEGTYGSDMEEDRKEAIKHLGAIPVEDLKELAAEWRDPKTHPTEDAYEAARVRARELEALLEEHTDE